MTNDYNIFYPLPSFLLLETTDWSEENGAGCRPSWLKLHSPSSLIRGWTNGFGQCLLDLKANERGVERDSIHRARRPMCAKTGQPHWGQNYRASIMILTSEAQFKQ